MEHMFVHQSASALAEALPKTIRTSYLPLSCLQSRGQEETWVCRDRITGERVIIKLMPTGEDGGLLQNEYQLLQVVQSTAPKGLRHRFPKAIAWGEEGGLCYLVRSHIPGMSLSEYLETQKQGQGLSREVAIQITRGVLEDLAFLHQLVPPVIHRDIKPQNVIVDPNAPGKDVSLIDFGIARTLRKSEGSSPSEGDTRILGTPLFAPPEQYGYQQTDARSDLYAVGVLLFYCLTGEYDLQSHLSKAQLDPDIRKVIEKATQFDPRRRYQDAGQMLLALQGLLSGGFHASRIHRQVAFALGGIVLLSGLGFLLGGRGFLPFLEEGGIAAPSSIVSAKDPAPDTWDFREPLIEEAVRQQLHQPEGEITLSQLEKIKALRIFGRQVYHGEDEFTFFGNYVFTKTVSYEETGLWRQTGDIDTLEDLSVMPALEEVCLYRQNLSDISALEGTGISYLGLGYNPLSDLSPLKGNTLVTGLNLSCLPGEVLEVLPSLPNLEKLVVSEFGEIPRRYLEGLPLKELTMADSWLDDEDVLFTFTGLEKMVLSKLHAGLLWHIKDLPIKSLEVAHVENVQLRELQDLHELQDLYYNVGGESAPNVLSPEPLSFPNLRNLDLKGMEIESLACLSDLVKLESLGLYDSTVQSYEGLDTLANLHLLYVTSSQKEQITAAYPDRKWSFYIQE